MTNPAHTLSFQTPCSPLLFTHRKKQPEKQNESKVQFQNGVASLFSHSYTKVCLARELWYHAKILESPWQYITLIYQKKPWRKHKTSINHYIVEKLKVFVSDLFKIFTLRYQNFNFLLWIAGQHILSHWLDPHPYPSQCRVDTGAAPILPSPSNLGAKWSNWNTKFTALVH